MENFNLHVTSRQKDALKKLDAYATSEHAPNEDKKAQPVKHNVPKHFIDLLKDIVGGVTNEDAIVKVHAQGGQIGGGAGPMWNGSFTVEVIPVD